jgi:hypothetical protein
MQNNIKKNLTELNKILIVCNTTSNPVSRSIVKAIENDYQYEYFSIDKKRPEYINKESFKSFYVIYYLIMAFNFFLKRISRIFTSKYFDYLHYFFYVEIFTFIQSFFIKNQYRIIICIETESAYMLTKKKKNKNVDIIYVIFEHYGFQNSNYNKITQKKMIDIEYKAINNSSVILSPNYTLAKFISDKYKLNKPIFQFISSSYSSNNDLKLDNSNQNKTRFIYIGGIGANRGLDLFIESFKDKNNYIFDIYGEGKHVNFLKTKIKALNLSDKIFLKGYIENSRIKDILKLYDVGISGAYLDNDNSKYLFGFKTIDYMSAGLGHIAPASIPLSELNLNANCMKLYKNMEVEDLSECIDFYLDIKNLEAHRINCINYFNKYLTFEAQKSNILFLLSSFGCIPSRV